MLSAAVPKNSNHGNFHGYSPVNKEFDEQCEIMRSPEQEANSQKNHIKQHLETNHEFFCHAKRQNTVTTYFTLIHE